MSYCKKQWSSDFTYEGLMDYFQNTPVVMAASATQDRMDRLLVVGTIDPETHVIDLEPLSVIPNAIEVEQRIPGDYAIVLRNSVGNELARYPFTSDVIEIGPGFGDEEHEELLGINELVPYVEGTVRVDIEKAGTVLETVQPGAASPTVIMEQSSGIPSEDGSTIYLSWTGRNADGDVLSYMVQYSPDNGETWDIIQAIPSGGGL